VSFAQRVADAIFNDATSGSAVWDELNGPEASIVQAGENKYTITVPQEYDEDGNQTGHVCVITVECGVP